MKQLRSNEEENSGPAYLWANSAGDESRTGTAGASAPRALTSRPSWSFKEEVPKNALSARFPRYSALIRAPPLVDHERNIYLSTVTSGSIYKINDEGKTLWTHKREPGVKLPGVSVIMNGSLYDADSNGTVFSLDMKTGDLNWATQIGSISEGTWSLAAARGIILVPAVNEDNLTGNPEHENTRVVAVHASNGSIAWKFDLAEPECRLYNPVFSVKKNSVVFSDSIGWLYRLKLKTGRVIYSIKTMGGRWRNTGGGAIIGPPGNTVYMTWNEGGWEVNKMTIRGWIAAFNWVDGKELWRRAMQYPVYGTASVGYIGKGQARVLAAVVSSGMKVDPPDENDPSRTLHLKKRLKHRLTAFSPEGEGILKGTYRWWVDLDDWFGPSLGDKSRPDACEPNPVSNPTIASDGSVYVADQHGDMIALQDDDENLFFDNWESNKTSFGVAFHAAPVIVPGMLLVTACDGLHVWKFNSSAPPLVM